MELNLLFHGPLHGCVFSRNIQPLAAGNFSPHDDIVFSGDSERLKSKEPAVIYQPIAWEIFAFVPSSKKTNMAVENPTIWRCISYPRIVMLVFRGVNDLCIFF